VTLQITHIDGDRRQKGTTWKYQLPVAIFSQIPTEATTTTPFGSFRTRIVSAY
jgi:hypothetical protein